MDDDVQLRRRSLGPPAARSMLMTILGEYVLPSGQGVWQETLIAALGSLGYKSQAARQALARSVAAGWLTTERHGRRARVGLSLRAVEMLRTGAERIYGFGDAWSWDERWLLIVLRVPEQRREVRHQLRTQLAWSGFGSLGGGLWLSPHIEREGELRASVPADSVAELQSFRAELGSIGEPEKLIASAWDLDSVADGYRDFTARFGRLSPRTPEAVFRAQTRLVHEWRRFPFLDPDLPEEMLPRAWPRSRAHRVFRDRHALWYATAQRHFASLDGVGLGVVRSSAA